MSEKEKETIGDDVAAEPVQGGGKDKGKNEREKTLKRAGFLHHSQCHHLNHGAPPS